MEWRCFGYYIVKPLPKPAWCSLKASRILSVSEDGLSEKFPDLTKCFWVNYPKRDRVQYQKCLQLSDAEFSAFCRLTADLFDRGRLAADVRFSCMEDVQSMYRYLRNTEGFRIVGIFTDAEIFREFEEEGTFEAVAAGKECTLPRHRLGCDLLGCECMGKGSFAFDSYLTNSLHEVIEAQANHYTADAQTGLIQNSYEETKAFSALIQGQGEFVIWTPFEVYEYASAHRLIDH